MINEAPQNIHTPESIVFNEPLPSNGTIKDTVSVKDSSIYKFQKWEYLVKKQTISGKDDLLLWFDELADQGWEIVNSQRDNLGFYIFKKISN